MQLPKALLDELKGIKGFDKEAFEKVHLSGEQVTSIHINPQKEFKACPSGRRVQSLPVRQAGSKPARPAGGFNISAIPWSQYGYYLKERPSFTFDPLFHAGCYYVQEASSMFLEQALKQTVDLSQSLKILDLCAAPGGKSTHIQSLISANSLLVSNEIIRSRAATLKENIIKWGSNNIIVTNNDPKDFAKLENYFDVIIVDAPCSGSGLFRRDPGAINEWSENNVQLCSQRQQRILADVWPALKTDGVLIYSTCSYSKQEDEDILDWIYSAFEIQNLKLKVDGNWGIVESNGGYRFWPDKIKGEGFFLACLRKKDGEETIQIKRKSKKVGPTKQEQEIVKKWANTLDLHLIKHDDTVYAWPRNLESDFNLLMTRLRVIYSGTIIGELMKDKLVPHHALAMSNLVKNDIERSELNYDEAIDYLKKKDLKIQNAEKGWRLVTYKGYHLGWINVLPGRINNYYPKESRILKES